MNNIIRIASLDTTYGGFHYIEFNVNTNEYRKGNSRYHSGYSNVLTVIEVKNKKELKDQENVLLNSGFIQVENPF